MAVHVSGPAVTDMNAAAGTNTRIIVVLNKQERMQMDAIKPLKTMARDFIMTALQESLALTVYEGFTFCYSARLCERRKTSQIILKRKLLAPQHPPL
jgi:hypothetical protein